MKTRSFETRIDVHHHLFPPFYVNILKELNMARSGGVKLPEWHPTRALEYMEQASITYGFLSITSPGIHFGNNFDSRKLAKKCNEYIAVLMHDFPQQWGGFAALPLPDVEGSLKELDYALSTLQLHGIGLLSNVDGHYLGDPDYDELWQELDRRHAVVFIHPHDPPGSELVSHLIPATEWPFDTAQTVASLLYSGVLEKYKQIRFILSHAGGVLPYIARRIAREANSPDSLDQHKAGSTQLNLLKGLYFDTCQSQNLWSLLTLLEFVNPSQILYGTDFGMSFVSRITQIVIKAGLRRYQHLFTPEQLRKIYRGNALDLFPDLKEKIKNLP